MPIPKLPKSEKATHHIIVTKDQHKKIHSLARRWKIRITELVDTMLFRVEKIEKVEEE